MTDTSEPVTKEEIEEWEEEHDEPHPVFRVDHRPERVPVATEETQRRVHFITQFEQLAQLAKAGKENIRRENMDAARADLHEARGRIESMMEDL